MPSKEDTQHDLLLIITTGLFFLFVTGLAVSSETEAPIIPPP
ncbi:hypothetical protein [Desulforamulus reducens]|nr:hypothetical protein [Desulforamulus reducens]